MNSNFEYCLLLFALFACFADRIMAEDRGPPRRELWVPTKHLDKVLRQHPNAVLLDRAQYEALIRDAGRVKPEDEKSEPPVDAVIEGVKLNVELIGGARKISIKAALTVNVLGDRWSEVRLLGLPADVVMTKFDGSNVALKEDAARTVLAVRGRGRHQVAMEFQSPLHRANRICTTTLPYLAWPCSITATPRGSAEVSERWLVRDGVATVPVVPPGGTATGMSITWTENAAAGAARDLLISEAADCLTTVNSAGVTSHVRLHLHSTSGPLPKILKFRLADADANVIAVDDVNVASWKQEGAVLEITRRSGFFEAGDFHVSILTPPPDGEGATPVVIEVPKLEGSTRIAVNIGLSVADDFDMTGWQLPGTAPDEAFRNYEESKKATPGETFLVHYDVAPARVIANIRRRGNHFSADVDNRIALSTHDVTMERTLALRGEEGRVNRATFTVPAGEQFIGLEAASGERVEWKQLEGGSFELIWAGGLQKGQASTLSLKTRRDLPAALAAGNDNSQDANFKTNLAFENLKLPEAIRLAGYVALDFDDSWKVAPTETTGLEMRDARVTPVKGRMAWFTLRDHKLALDIARNEAVLDAGVIAYALPRAKNVEIEGQVVLDVSRAPLRKFEVKLPAESAKLLRWDSPLIGGQTLDAATGVWHLTLRKELLGVANVRFHLSLPAEGQKSEAGSQKSAAKNENATVGETKPPTSVLSATLPDLELPAARRFTGAWVVEANTDTELSCETKGMQPLDALQAPPVEGYVPRHRVLAVHGYGSGAHELRITAKRHEPGALVSAVVNEMKMTSVIGRDGVGRHEAALLVKHNGQQFFGVRLPRGAALLSARAGGQPVKPVRAAEDEVRVPLPVNQSADLPVWIVVTYELRASAWGASGTAKLIPPRIGEGVPVLSSSWRVFTPDGMEVGADGGHGWQFDPLERTALLGLLSGYLDLLTPASSKISPGARVRFLPGGKAGEQEMVDLKPEYPKPRFVGTPVPTTAAVSAAPANEASIAERETSRRITDQKGGALDFSGISGKAGLISLEIAVPAAGRVFEFRGNQRPDVITLRYESWERQMRKSVLWALLGLGLFFLAGRRRMWLLTVAVALLLTCVPLAFAPAWLVVCNAVLAGWLAGFVVCLAWRAAQWIEKKLGAWVVGHEAGGFAAILFVSFACFADRIHAGDKPDPAAHTVIVPYDLAQPRDPQRANRYYLDYAEFQKLWELAKENRRPAKSVETDAKSAPEAFINSALYDARIEDDKLVVTARFTVLSRGAKWAKLPLPFKGEGLTVAEVKLDGGTALFEQGVVHIENPGAHVLEVTLQLLRGRSWKEAGLEVPRAPTALIALTAPATDGRPVFGGPTTGALVTEEARGGLRVSTLPLGAASAFSITRTPGRKLVTDAPPAQADTKLLLRVLPRLEKVSAEVGFNFSGTERRTLTVELDPSLRLEGAAAVPAAEATLRKEGGRQFVDFQFPQTVADSAKVTIGAERVFEAAAGNRTAPLVLGSAARRGSTVEVQSSDELQVRVDEAGAGSFQVAADKTLRYGVSNAEDRSRSRVEAVHQFTAQKAEIIAAITLDTGRAPLAGARIGVPPGFEVQTLTGPRVQSWHREGGFLVVRFDTQPQREAKLVLHLAKTLAQPGASWILEPLKLPQFAKYEGVAFIAVHAADDVKLAFDGADRKVSEVGPGTLPSVVSVAPPFQLKRALTIGKADWSAEVTLTRQAPRFSADTILLARAGDLGLGLSQQVGLVVEQGALGSVKVRLPKSLPEARVHGPLVRDAQSRIAGESREYEVSFQTEVLDRVEFTMDFELPLEGEKNLPSVRVDGAARIQRFVIIDNAGSREMKLDAGGAEAAVKESLPYLPEGLARPRFLRANEMSAVKLSFTQLESTAGNAAIITLAEITTALRANGERWETVVYSLANRSLQFLPVKLPEGAELIEVSVGGQTVRADRADRAKISNDKSQSTNSFLAPLIQMRAGELSQQVKLVYRFAGTKRVDAAHRFQQPELVGLSAERTLWNVWVPEKFAAKKFDGNMEEIGGRGSELEKLQSELSDIARLNRVLAGGNLSREEMLYCWGNLNAKMGEVRKLQADNRGKLRQRLYESVDEVNLDKLGKVVSQLDLEVDKQIQQQGALIVSNSTIVERAKQQVPVPGDLQVRGRHFQDQGQGRQHAAQGWAYNKDAPPQQRKAGQSQLTLNYARSGMVDLNDNVSLNGGEFFKSQSGVIVGSGGVTKAGDGAWALTKSGAGTFTLPGHGNVAPAQQGDTKNFNAGNARAGQGVQLAQQAATAGAAGTGNLTFNAGTTASIGAGGGGFGVNAPAAPADPFAARGPKHPATTFPPAAMAPMRAFASSAAPMALPSIEGTIAGKPAPAAAMPQIAEAAKGEVKTDAAQGGDMIRPGSRPAAGKDLADRVAFRTDDDSRRMAITPQLKPVGRVSLAVDVPLDGKVYHFSKLKDHALIEVTVVKPLDQRQTGALWVVGVGLAVLLLVEFARRSWSGRRRAGAL